MVDERVSMQTTLAAYNLTCCRSISMKLDKSAKLSVPENKELLKQKQISALQSDVLENSHNHVDTVSSMDKVAKFRHLKQRSTQIVRW